MGNGEWEMGNGEWEVNNFLFIHYSLLPLVLNLTEKEIKSIRKEDKDATVTNVIRHTER
jgi:hypothetical protein